MEPRLRRENRERGQPGDACRKAFLASVERLEPHASRSGPPLVHQADLDRERVGGLDIARPTRRGDPDERISGPALFHPFQRAFDEIEALSEQAYPVEGRATVSPAQPFDQALAGSPRGLETVD